MNKQKKLNSSEILFFIIMGLVFISSLFPLFKWLDEPEFTITKEVCSEGRNIPLFIEKFNNKFIIAYDGNPEGTSARMFAINETQIIIGFSLAGLEETDKNFIARYLKENSDKIGDIYWEDVCLVERGDFMLGRDIASCNYEELLEMSYHYGQYYPHEFIDLNLKKNDNKLYNLKNIKIEGEGIREYENKIKNLRYDQNNIKVILTFEQYDYPILKQEKVCEQVEVDEFESCIYFESGSEVCIIKNKEDLIIDWLDTHDKCIEYYPYPSKGKCLKYEINGYEIEVLE